MSTGVEAAPRWELGAQRDAEFVQAFGSGALPEIGRRWGIQMGPEGVARRYFSAGVRVHCLSLAVGWLS